ncbi:MAG: ABC transporter ATP-binding protein [Thermoproteota archaeon]
MRDKPPVVEATGLTKIFKNVRAIDNLTFRIEGRIAGLIGPNGSGKTTLLNIVLGLTKKDSGELAVLGENDPRRLVEEGKVSGMPESINPPEHFTGLDFLVKIAKMKGLSSPKEQAVKLLNQFSLVEAKDRMVSTYSAGMKQRLLIAQTLLGEPELVVLDEPTANLDPNGRIIICDAISSISMETGTRFLISSHLLFDLESICDWLSFMHSGKLKENGPIQEILNKYRGVIFRLKSTDPLRLKRLLSSINSVRSAFMIRDELIVSVKNDEALKKITNTAAQAGVRIEEATECTPTLDLIYREVVSRP